MKFFKLCDDYGIKYWQTGFKYCSADHVQIDCPFCDNSKGPHMGWHLKKHYFNCWSCGWSSTPKVLMALCDVDYPGAKKILQRYKGKEKDLYLPGDDDNDRPDKCHVPGKKDLLNMHKNYLEDRGYDPESLQDIWDIRGTNFAGQYKYRVIAPIYYRGRIVSYQGRDVTGKQLLRWKACPKDFEILEHQRLLYGYDDCSIDRAILVEGITDVWKMGVGTICGFGMGLTKPQKRLLKRFSQLFIIFDSEKQAQKLGNDLAKYLSSTTNMEVYNVDIGMNKDPGDLNKLEVREIRKDLLGII